VEAPRGSERSLPVLVREGAIIPMTAPALNIPSRLFDRYTFHIYPAAGRTSPRTFKDRARAVDDSQVITAEVTDDSAGTGVTIEGALSVEAIYVHGAQRPLSVTVNDRIVREQTMGACGEGWSYGNSDFPLQSGTTVLKVQLEEGANTSLRIEFMALATAPHALLRPDARGETLAIR
jgi:hypothetical protein